MDQLSQADLEKLLNEDKTKVSGDNAVQMKDNILNNRGTANYLGVGTHEVFIESIELMQAKSGTLGMRITVENPEGKSDATFWLSEAALPYSIQNVSNLVVHNTPDDKKDDARNFMSNIVNGKDLLKVAKEKLSGGAAYLVIKESASQTYQNKNGETVASLEKNLQSWKPKETVERVMGTTEAVSEEEAQDIPF